MVGPDVLVAAMAVAVALLTAVCLALGRVPTRTRHGATPAYALSPAARNRFASIAPRDGVSVAPRDGVSFAPLHPQG